MISNSELKKFNCVPLTSLWRLLVDVNHQNLDASFTHYEEKEPGYLESMFAGLNLILKNVNTPLTIEFIEKLHDTCVGKIKLSYAYIDDNGEIKTMLEKFPLGIRRNEGTSFGLIVNGWESNVSEQGMRELLEKLADGDNYFEVKGEYQQDVYNASALTDKLITEEFAAQVIEKIKNSSYVISINRSPNGQNSKNNTAKVIRQRMASIIQQYQQTIATATEQDTKLNAIVSCIHELELTHPFYDGNCRTFGILLLNKLLLQEGFSPTVVANADAFDAYGTAELCEMVRKGMKFFEKETGDCSEPGIIFLHNNDVIAQLVIQQVFAMIDHRKSMPVQAQTKLTGVLQQALTNIEGPLSHEDVSKLLKYLANTVNQSCDKPYLFKQLFYRHATRVNFNLISTALTKEQLTNCLPGVEERINFIKSTQEENKNVKR